MDITGDSSTQKPKSATLDLSGLDLNLDNHQSIDPANLPTTKPSLISDGILSSFRNGVLPARLNSQGISRAEFLAVLGLTSVSVVGASSVITKIVQDRVTKTIETKTTNQGQTGPQGPSGPQGPRGARGPAGEATTGTSGGATTSDGSTGSDTTAADLEAHKAATTDVHGIADTAALATQTYADDAVSAHAGDTTAIHGIADTGVLAVTNADNNFSTAQTFISTITASNYKRGTGSPEGNVTGSVGDLFLRTDGAAGTTLYIKESGSGTNTGWVAVSSGSGVSNLDDLSDVTITTVADEEFLVYDAGTTQWRNRTIVDADIPATIARDSEVSSEISTHNADTTAVHGIADTSVLETTSGSQAKVDAHTGDTTDAHDASAISFVPAGTIAATDTQAAIEEVAIDAAGALSTHEADTTAIHGIADTASLVTLAGTQTLTNKTITSTTNDVAAKSLHSATTVVDVSTATAPSSGQVLTATSSTAATWQAPSTNLAVTSKTAAYTATTADSVILCSASGGAFTVTLPTAVGNTGKVFHIKKTDSSANAVTVDGNGAQTIDGSTTAVINVQYASITIVSDNANWHII